MKKLSLILGLVVLMCMIVSSQAFAAPDINVSAKYQFYAGPGHTAQVEFGLPLSDNFTVLVQGGPFIPPFAGVAMAGVRYYVTETGLRPFATIYGGCLIGGVVDVAGAATVGLEYSNHRGFRVAAEIGAWATPGWASYTGGVSVGFRF